MKTNIFLTGFSGTGKTTVGTLVSQRLGWNFIDIDSEIEQKEGKSIDRIFSESGEDYFRSVETTTLAKYSKLVNHVVSTGGGIPQSYKNRQIMEESGFVVCLEARPETIFSRIQQQELQNEEFEIRPMLEGGKGIDRISELKNRRQSNYALADWTIHTDGKNPLQVVEEIINGWHQAGNIQQETKSDQTNIATTVRTSSGNYPIYVGWDVLNKTGEHVKALTGTDTSYVITDEGAQQHARTVRQSLENKGVTAHTFVIQSGEKYKSMATAQKIFQWLASHKAERGHMILAVGGGVVGDLAGWIAATYLRGIPYAHIPTTLLAMMDSSIGGKVAIDLPEGKNLVGAFYQPKFVLSDVHVLETLPERELKSGWAEAIKHGLIMEENLLSEFESKRGSILSLDPNIAPEIIGRSVAIKADVVSKDERETLGLRILLNYGHTIGHAIEVSTSYETFLHGEAVSIGMPAAAYIGNSLGLMSDAEVMRQTSILHNYGLPTTCQDLKWEEIRMAMRSDKKTTKGSIQWVLLDKIGNAVTRRDVSESIIEEAIIKLSTTNTSK